MPNPLLSNAHFEAFGRIAYGYARVEVGLKYCLIAMADIGLVEGMTMCAPYSAYNLNSVIKSVARDKLEAPFDERLIALVDRWFEFTHVRTVVAHHQWRRGTRPDSIRAAYADVKTGHLQLKGFADEEPDYTLPELYAVANRLYDLSVEVTSFRVESGMDASISLKNPEIKEARDTDDGR